MSDSKLKYQKYDWEGIVFPLVLNCIESLTHHYNFPYDSELKIWRDEAYRLQGVIQGVAENRKDLEYKENGNVKKVGFIEGESLKAKSDDNIFLIEGLWLENINFSSIEENGKLKIAFSCNVYMESVSQIGIDESSTEILSEWFLCSMPEVLFSRTTYRYLSHNPYKIRKGFDAPVENEVECLKNGFSDSWDFAVVSHGNYEIIIQTVSKDYLPIDTDGIAIEYRALNLDFPPADFRKMFQEYVSFIWGTHLQKVGESKFKNGYELLSCKSQNPWKRRIKNNGNINPIPLKNNWDRSFFEKQMNKLLDNFICVYEKTSLSACLWNLWIGIDIAIGPNLPIIASGFEMLINSYLEKNNLIRKYTKQEKSQYRELIKDDLESLKEKLSNYDFAPFVLNKLQNPYNYGIGEKIRIFFKDISIEFDGDSIENRALRARNLATHNSINFNLTENQNEIKKLSDAYVTLVNRTILRLLEYDSYYIDYSKEGIRYLKMSENM